MAWAVVFGNFVDCVAITYPIEVASPKVWVDGREDPSSGGDFANVGVVV